MKKILKNTLDALINVFDKDDRIHSVFITGSMIDNSLVTPFSDIDIWIILHEESYINSIKNELSHIFRQVSPIRIMYPCTDYHYFVIFENGVQIDFNMATAACYYSLTSSQKKILLDKNRSYVYKGFSTISKHHTFISEKLLIGYTTLERAISKYLKKDYVVTVRFLDLIRSNIIFSLLPFVENVSIPNVVSVPLDKFSKKIRKQVVTSYAKPIKESCREAIIAIMLILNYISKKTKSHVADDIHYKLYTVLNSL
jgi:hypothetical protein